MKPNLNQKRRAARGFNGIDKATGYAVRFEKTKQGWWCSLVSEEGFLGCSLAPSLRTVKRHTNECIWYWLEDIREKGLPIPEPKRTSR